MSDRTLASAATGSSVLYRSPRYAYPIAVAADGMTISDADGRKYLDMSGGAAVSCLGHGHPDVIDAICKQAETVAFAHTAFFTSEPQETLARIIASRFAEPGARVYFNSGGSEANETAMKLAWQYWAARDKPGKKIIISREHSYHGNTFGALSVSGNDLRRRASAAPLLDWPRIQPCYPYRERLSYESLEEYACRAADHLELALVHCGADNVAAVILEPIVGSSLGVVAAAPGYLRRIRDICDRFGVLLIADEIMCGSGRSGHFFAHRHDDVIPDIVTLAKGIGGGYQPLAAVVLRDNIATELSRAGFAHGHTYIGHAIACAAGVAVQNVIDRDDLLARTRDQGTRFIGMLEQAFADHPHVGEVRGRGLFAGIELVSNRTTKAGFNNGAGLAEQLRQSAMHEGLICYPGSIQVDGHTVPHIMLAPPMIVEHEHMIECIAKLNAVFDAVLS
ncbi:MAG: aspartate aminotransferase family protein [Woeseia sp.]